MDYIFTSEEARQLNKDIFETIYYAAISESNDLCKTEQYKPYKFFELVQFQYPVLFFSKGGNLL